MPPAYLIARIDITDDAAYAKYREQVPATIAQYGGEYLTRGGRFESLEGEAPPPRTVILKFPSFEQAKAWYDSPEYAGPKAIRQAASTGDAMLIEGVD